MDSSDLEITILFGAMPTDFADNSSVMPSSERDIFLSTYRRQSFTLSDSIMHYIAKNPKNPNFYQKMVECCKHFFVENPILVIDYLYYNLNGWEACVNKTWENIDVNRILCKLWITLQLFICPKDVSNNSFASSIIPKIYEYTLKNIILCDQTISLNELMILSSSVEELRLRRATVVVVAIEKIIERFPKVRESDFDFTNPSNNTSKNTFTQLWKIPHLSNYESFGLNNIPDHFDIDSFYSFMKKNKKTRVSLIFSNTISEANKIRLEAIIDEIIDTKNREYKPPYITFLGLDEKNNTELYLLYLQ